MLRRSSRAAMSRMVRAGDVTGMPSFVVVRFSRFRARWIRIPLRRCRPPVPGSVTSTVVASLRRSSHSAPPLSERRHCSIDGARC